MPWPLEANGNIVSQLHCLYNALKFDPFVILAGESVAGVGWRPSFSQRLMAKSPALPDCTSICRIGVRFLRLGSWLRPSRELRFPKVQEEESLRALSQHYILRILREEPVGGESAPAEANLIQVLTREAGSAFGSGHLFPFL